MSAPSNLVAFSTYRLNGESVPPDLAILVNHADAFSQKTGIELNWQPGWAPWLDTSYLNETDLANPDILANVKAIAEVCRLIAFVAAHEDGEYYGYWRGYGQRPVTESPLVRLDNEGQFCLMSGRTFAEAILAQKFEQADFGSFHQWLTLLGIVVPATHAEALTMAEGERSPGELHELFFYRYRLEAGLSGSETLD
jgi:hypothetical protein